MLTRGLQRFAVLLLLLPVLMLGLPFAPTASAHAGHSERDMHKSTNNGRIVGHLLDGTNKNTPLSNQKVTLQLAQGSNSKDFATATTDAHGSYSFDNLSTDKTLSYVTYILYQGAQYTSNVVTLDSKPVQTLDLTVYEATTSTADIAVLQTTLLLRQPDVQHGVLNVSEIFFFRNIGARTFVGTFGTNNGQHKPNALRFSLPGNAKSVTLGTGFDGYHTAQVDLGFATDAAIPPGESQFSFSFQIPYTASTYDLSYTVVYPTLQLSVLIPTDLHVDSGFLTSGGVITTNNRPYQMFQGSELRSDDQVHVQLQGLPLQDSSNNSAPLNTTTIWLIVAGLVLLGLLVAFWYLRFGPRSRRLAGGKRGQGKMPRNKMATVSTTHSSDVKEARQDAKKEALLQELLALDKAFEAGKITKAAYQERRTKTKARLRSIMRDAQAVPEAKSQQSKQTKIDRKGQEASR